MIIRATGQFLETILLKPAAAWMVTFLTKASTKCFFSMAVLVDQFHKLESNRLFQGNILLKSKF